MTSLPLRRLGLLAIIIVAAIAGGVILYLAFLRPYLTSRAPEQSTPSTSSLTPGGTLPTAPQGSPRIIDQPGSLAVQTGIENFLPPSISRQQQELATATRAQSAAFAPSIDHTSGATHFYNPRNGQFYTIDTRGTISMLSTKYFPQARNVLWSPDAQKAIISFPDDTNILYDFDAQTQTSLPKYWQDFSFSPQGDQIAAKSIGLDPSNRWLITSDLDGSNIKLIEPLGENADRVNVAWSPNQQIIATYTEGIDTNRQTLYFIGKAGEQFKSTIIPGRGLRSSWSPTGNTLLYSVYTTDNNMTPELWAVDASGERTGSNRRPIGIATSADKCAFASEGALYCAVPTRLPEGSGLFPELLNTIPDQLYRINLATGSTTLVGVTSTQYNMTHLIVNSATQTMQFVDALTGNLVELKLTS